MYKAEDFIKREVREEFEKDWFERTEQEITILSFSDIIEQIEDKLVDFNYDDNLTDAEIEKLEESEEPYQRNGHYYFNYLGTETRVYFIERFEGSSSTLHFTEIEF